MDRRDAWGGETRHIGRSAAATHTMHKPPFPPISFQTRTHQNGLIHLRLRHARHGVEQCLTQQPPRRRRFLVAAAALLVQWMPFHRSLESGPGDPRRLLEYWEYDLNELLFVPLRSMAARGSSQGVLSGRHPSQRSIEVEKRTIGESRSRWRCGVHDWASIEAVSHRSLAWPHSAPDRIRARWGRIQGSGPACSVLSIAP